MCADGVSRAKPGQRNQQQCGNDDGSTANPADRITLGKRLARPSSGMTVLVDMPLLSGQRASPLQTAIPRVRPMPI